MATPVTNDAQLTGNVLFYSRPEPLSREEHSKIGLRRMDKPFGFAAAYASIVALPVQNVAGFAVRSAWNATSTRPFGATARPGKNA